MRAQLVTAPDKLITSPRCCLVVLQPLPKQTTTTITIATATRNAAAAGVKFPPRAQNMQSASCTVHTRVRPSSTCRHLDHYTSKQISKQHPVGVGRKKEREKEHSKHQARKAKTKPAQVATKGPFLTSFHICTPSSPTPSQSPSQPISF